MPHFVIEYSANLDGEVDWSALVEIVRKAAAETGVFPVGGIRVRAYRADHYAIADGDPAHGFIAMVASLGAGRDLAARQAAGARVFDALSAALDPLFERHTIGLTFSMREIDPELSWKRNNIHDALKPKV